MNDLFPTSLRDFSYVFFLLIESPLRDTSEKVLRIVKLVTQKMMNVWTVCVNLFRLYLDFEIIFHDIIATQFSAFLVNRTGSVKDDIVIK